MYSIYVLEQPSLQVEDLLVLCFFFELSSLFLQPNTPATGSLPSVLSFLRCQIHDTVLSNPIYTPATFLINPFANFYLLNFQKDYHILHYAGCLVEYSISFMKA